MILAELRTRDWRQRRFLGLDPTALRGGWEFSGDSGVVWGEDGLEVRGVMLFGSGSMHENNGARHEEHLLWGTPSHLGATDGGK